VHYVGHYTISFQNARSLQHKIWNCSTHISSRILFDCAPSLYVCFSETEIYVMTDDLDSRNMLLCITTKHVGQSKGVIYKPYSDVMLITLYAVCYTWCV
jgi:hypothetical protein